MRSPSHSKHAMNRPVQQESSAAPIAAASATTPTGRQDAPFTFQHTPTLYTEELAVEDGVRLLGSLQVPGSPEETEAEKKRSHFFKAVDLRAARPPACAQLRLRSIHYSISRGERGGACCAAVFTCVARAGPAAAPRCTQIPGPSLPRTPGHQGYCTGYHGRDYDVRITASACDVARCARWTHREMRHPRPRRSYCTRLQLAATAVRSLPHTQPRGVTAPSLQTKEIGSPVGRRGCRCAPNASCPAASGPERRAR